MDDMLSAPAMKRLGYGAISFWSFVLMGVGAAMCFYHPLAGAVMIFNGVFCGSVGFAIKAYLIVHGLDKKAP
jgi:hypothetical protein